MNDNVEILSVNLTGSFKGVEIKRIPKVGGGWSYSVGSDRYGGTIRYVSPDLSWFIGDGEIAKLETRKNAVHYGRYVAAYFKHEANPEFLRAKNALDVDYLNQHYKEIYNALVLEKTCRSVGCLFHNVRSVSDTPCKTYLDPSF